SASPIRAGVMMLWLLNPAAFLTLLADSHCAIDEDDGMAAQFNHTIVWSSDQTMSARFLAEMLGRPAPTRFGHFDVVELDNGVSLDFADAEGPIRPQHYAFLI